MGMHLPSIFLLVSFIGVCCSVSCDKESEIGVRESHPSTLSPPTQSDGSYSPGVQCQWQVIFPAGCHNSIALSALLRPLSDDSFTLTTTDSEKKLLSVSSNEEKRSFLLEKLPRRVTVSFYSQDNSTSTEHGFWAATLKASQCDGIEEGDLEVRGETLWIDLSRIPAKTRKVIRLASPAFVYMAATEKNDAFLRGVKITGEGGEDDIDLLSSHSTSKKGRSPSSPLSPLFSVPRSQFTLTNSNDMADSSHSASLYFVSETMKSNNLVYEAGDQEGQVEMQFRRVATILSPPAQISVQNLRLGKHGGVSITAGGVAEHMKDDHQLIRLTDFSTANLSSYTFFVPILTFTPSSNEKITFQFDTKSYVNQASVPAGARGVVMSTGYPSFGLLAKPIKYSMRFTNEVHVQMHLRASLENGSRLTLKSSANISDLAHSFTKVKMDRGFDFQSNEIDVEYTPVGSEHDNFLITFTTEGAATFNAFVTILLLCLTCYVQVNPLHT